MKQGIKLDHATSLVEMASTKCSAVKYDVDLAEEYIARQVSAVAMIPTFLFRCDTKLCHIVGKCTTTKIILQYV